jgi:GNAT superfamily N-acetyltransferase
VAGDSVAVVQATLAEVDDVFSILNEAAQWLWDRGIPQWQPGSIKREKYVQLAESGALWLARQNSEIVGTVTLLWSDPEIWGPDDGKAGYIHKLAVKRAVAGQGVSTLLLRTIESQIRAAHRSLARLDCWAGNNMLRRFYSNQGYTLLDAFVEETWEVARFEKHVAEH